MHALCSSCSAVWLAPLIILLCGETLPTDVTCNAPASSEYTPLSGHFHGDLGLTPPKLASQAGSKSSSVSCFCFSGKWACPTSMLGLHLAMGKSARAVQECYKWDVSHLGKHSAIAPLSAIAFSLGEPGCGVRCNLAGSHPKRPSRER